MPEDGYLTISVDDGHPADRRTGDLLWKYGLKATFYIPARNQERKVMGAPDISAIAAFFDVGAHGYNHKPLKGMPEKEIKKEVRDGKDWLEQLLGREVVSFCYPKGKFDANVIRFVRETGFKGGRTCMFNINGFPRNPFLWGLSTNAYPHSIAVQVRHALLEGNFQGMIDFFRIHKASIDWVYHFELAVRHVERNGGIAHLYFHSWEIDELDEWGRLEDLCRYLSEESDLKRVTNNELFTLWHER